MTTTAMQARKRDELYHSRHEAAKRIGMLVTQGVTPEAWYAILEARKDIILMQKPYMPTLGSTRLFNSGGCYHPLGSKKPYDPGGWLKARAIVFDRLCNWGNRENGQDRYAAEFPVILEEGGWGYLIIEHDRHNVATYLHMFSSTIDQVLLYMGEGNEHNPLGPKELFYAMGALAQERYNHAHDQADAWGERMLELVQQEAVVEVALSQQQ